MSAIQDKLIKVTRIKPKKYTERQAFLHAIALYVSEKLTNDEYDLLANQVGEAIDWYETAAEAINHKINIPDFPDLEPGDIVLPEPAEVLEPTPQEIKIEKAVARYKNVTGERDKWGSYKGTKVSDALALFEQGATMKQVQDATGGMHYNKLHQLVDEGHKVEKLKGKIWKLTHKDEIVDPTTALIEDVAIELWDKYANYESGDYPTWVDIIDETATINTRDKFRKMAARAIEYLREKEETR